MEYVLAEISPILVISFHLLVATKSDGARDFLSAMPPRVSLH
jgi:hypothetical protein